MKPATKEQIKAINAILVHKGLMDDKAGIIKAATNDRTAHSSQLYFSEAKVLLANFLSTGKMQPKNKMIGKIFAMAHEMGWIKRKTLVNSKGEVNVTNDYTPVYAWIKKYGFNNPKDLKEYKFDELPKLLTQFEFGPYADYLRKL